jgi:predicted NAD/FAD-binding protein
MASSIWSTPPSEAFGDFPARTLLQFMHNHHLLQILDRPQWLTLHGGSKSYVERVVSRLPKEQIHQGSKRGKVIEASRNDAEKWTLRTGDGEVHEFDRVIFATHADTTVKMLRGEWDDDNSSRKVRTCLENFNFRKNRATLHSDERVSSTLLFLDLFE